MDPTPRPLLDRLIDAVPHTVTEWEDSTVPDGAGPAELAAAPRPVVVVHGTTGSRHNFANIAPLLKEKRPVLSVSYGYRGTGDLRTSLDQVVAQIDDVTSRHGAVDLVGHSQGGLLSLAAAGILGDRINHVIGLAGDFRGVTRPWFRPPESRLLHRIDRALAPALADQLIGSPALAEVLGHTTGTAAPVTQIITRGDIVVPVARSTALRDDDPLSGLPAHRGPVQVVEIQDRFPDVRVNHAVMPRYREVGELIDRALTDPPQVNGPRSSGSDGPRRP